MEIFCNIINVFAVTYAQFNVPLMNKNIHFLNCTYPKLLNEYLFRAFVFELTALLMIFYFIFFK